MKTPLEIVQEIFEEREKQDEKWGGSKHDDNHYLSDWTAILSHYVGKLGCGPLFRHKTKTDLLGLRIALIKLAAVAIAAIQSIDRHLERKNYGQP